MPAQTDPQSSALEAVLRRFGRMVRSVGAKHGLDDRDLDEVVQDVRIRLWRARETGTIGALSSSYVYRTARSAILDLMRRRRLPREVLVPGNDSLGVQLVHPDPAPDRSAEESELAATIHQAVDDLIESRRVPVRMHLLGYQSREIAARLGWSGPKTRNLLSRGMADLRERLRARGIGPEGFS
ncbi:MAG TPA: sigma-70 family RNA polymerase sigma factor [Gemmatimonadales bacterium]|jgi:RNA polymerase sigma-70 factor (ECF subfamily)|nr:sigma-70 family RNA polymerase sigma factor [Gemmatimonadales bacterium]